MLGIGSLFSGIGGLEHGLELAGLGPVRWQVEKDAFRRRVLEKHWPAVKRFPDVTTIDPAALDPVDVVCGGFPCQDVSHPGTRAGLDGARSGLWFEMLRIVRALRPRYVVVENSTGLVVRGLERVLGGLAGAGYDAIWFPLRATDAGAPHRRARVWIVAYTNDVGRAREPSHRLHAPGAPRDDADGRSVYPPRRGDEDGWRAYAERGGREPGVRRGPDGLLSGVDRARLGALGDAVVPQCAEIVGWVVRSIHERGAP